MSTARRSTRASSRTSASPAPSNVTTATAASGRTSVRTPARRSVRDIADLPPLPTIAAQASTAYGSSTTVTPLKIGKIRGDDVGSALGGILAPTRDPDPVTELEEEEEDEEAKDDDAHSAATAATAARGSTTATPQARRIRGAGATPRAGRARASRAASVTSTPGDNSRTFSNESGINVRGGFGAATPAKPGVAPIVEEPEEDSDQPNTEVAPARPNARGLWPQSVDEQWENLHRIRDAERQAVMPDIIGALSASVSSALGAVSHLFISLFHIIQAFIKKLTRIPVKWWLPVLILVGLTSLQAGYEGPVAPVVSWGRGLLSDATNSIFDFRFLPRSTSSSRLYRVIDKDDLEQRITVLEREINSLKKRTKLDQGAIDLIEKKLPEFVVFRKGKKGYEVPLDFWHALKSLMQEESPIIKDYFIANETGEVHPSGGQYTDTQVRKIANAKWKEFVQKNEARWNIWEGNGVEKAWQQSLKEAFKNDVLVPKSEVIQLIEQQYADSQKMLKSEIGRIKSQISHQLRNASPEPNEPHAVGLTESQVQEIAQTTVKKLGHAIAIEALANYKIKQAASDSLKRVNHFSRGNGAIVNPKLTSPTFPLASRRIGWIPWVYAKAIGWDLPKEHPPIMALSKWDEAGDCWCSPAKGHGPVQLAVKVKQLIYPDAIVIEHIPASATLDPYATPRKIDLFANFETVDGETIRRLGKMSETAFNPSPAVDGNMGKSWVRIARFNSLPFDADHYRQTFQIPLDLKGMEAATQEMVVRVVTNSGSDHTCLYRVLVNGEVPLI